MSGILSRSWIELHQVRRSGLLTTLLLLLCISSYTNASENKQIRIMFYEWAPYASSKVMDLGFTADIVLTAFRQAGYEVKYEFFPWLRALKNLETGRWDVLVNLYYSEERATKYAYPKNHIAVSAYTLFALKKRADIPKFISTKELKKLNVGLVEKASYGKLFDEMKATLPTTQVSMRERHLLRMMLTGRVDIVPSDIQFGWNFLHTNTEKADQVRVVESDMFIEKKLYPVFTKKNKYYQQYISDWDASMENMIKNGSLKRLHEKHEAVYRR